MVFETLCPRCVLCYCATVSVHVIAGDAFQVEGMLEREYAQSEAAIEAARIKLQNAQEKYDTDIKKERENVANLLEEVSLLRAAVARKTQESKKQDAETENLREQVTSYHDKIIHLKRQIEELSVDLVNQRNMVAEAQHKHAQAERALADLATSHRREKIELEQQVGSGVPIQLFICAH